MMPKAREAAATVHRLAKRFAEAGIDTPRLDARMLVAHVLGVRPQDVSLKPDLPLSAEHLKRLEDVAARRMAREPVSRIIGRRGFWTLDLEISPATLDPRPDTETLVEAVLDRYPDRNAALSIADLGTGTGCILLALLSEFPNASGLGIDLSSGALEVAGRNAERNGLAARASFVKRNWGAGVDETFDIVVSNPPYIPETDIAALEPEVREFDPRSALAAGADGLDAYRELAPHAWRMLRPGGMTALEVGAGQVDDVAALLRAQGFDTVWNRRDLADVERCVCAAKAI
jgi:release factor glutamine methyltransferase